MSKGADETDNTEEKQSKPHLYKPGQTGNPKGRPKGSKNKLAEDFLKDVQEVWAESGITALRAAVQEKPSDFCKMVAGLVPKDVNVTADHTVTHVGEPVSATADWIAGLLRERQSKPAKKPVSH